MGPVLDKHIRGALIAVSLIVALALSGISGFITFVEELDNLGQGGYALLEVIAVTALKMPEIVYELFPLIVLLGTIMGLGTLAAGGELVVIQSVGVSVLRIAWSAMKGGLLLGALCLVLGDFVVPTSRALADGLKGHARFGEPEFASRSVWLREGPNFIRIGRLPSESHLQAVETFVFHPGSRELEMTLRMADVYYQDGGWVGHDVRSTRIGAERVEVTHEETAAWPVRLEPDLLRLFVLRADSLSLAGLQRYIEYLDANGLDATAPRYAFWRKLSVPLTVLVMTLLAVPFVLGPLRDTGAGQRLFVGVMVGIGFYLANEVTASLGQVYGLSAPLAALLPTTILSLIAGWRLHAHVTPRG